MQLLFTEEGARRQQDLPALAAVLAVRPRRLIRIARQEQSLTVAELERWGQVLQVHPLDLVHFEGVPDPRRCACCCHRWQHAQPKKRKRARRGEVA